MQEIDLQSEINRLRALAGVTQGSGAKSKDGNDSPLTYAGTERAEYAREHKIKPGTDEWFRLWFSRPYLTGDSGIDK